jgi:hypothetical protein
MPSKTRGRHAVPLLREAAERPFSLRGRSAVLASEQDQSPADAEGNGFGAGFRA